MDVPRFEEEWPDILQYGIERQLKFPAFDQGWLNEYFLRPGKRSKVRSFEPVWNWKLYWSPTVQWESLRVVHFHGVKPGRMLECVAILNETEREACSSPYAPQLRSALLPLVHMSKGAAHKYTARGLDLFQKLALPLMEGELPRYCASLKPTPTKPSQKVPVSAGTHHP